MSFLSIKFLILLIILIILINLTHKDIIKRIILLAGGYVFYSFFGILPLTLLIVLSLFTGLGGWLTFKYRRSEKHNLSKIICSGFIITEIIVLCFFKYTDYFPMPAGLSFYLLQTISFLVDSYRGEFKEFPSLLNTLIYINFFPVIVSGPIQRSRKFMEKLSDIKPLNRERLSYGIQLFLLGAFLKLVMADRLAVAVNCVYSTPNVYSGLTLFITSVAYSLQLLFDFAGYSDMAIGVACLLGFELDKNFNLPYLSTNPSEFWKRWHISLSEWLRDYVYIPLGGNRKGKIRTYINTFITMIISGLWHGSTINFLIWGALHGFGQVIYRVLSKNIKKQMENSSLSHFVSIILNFLFINFLWIPFKASDLNEAWIIISRIITLRPGAGYYYIYTFIFGILLIIVQYIAIRYNGGNNPFKPLPLNKLCGKIVFCCFIIAIAMFAYFGNSAFIYAQF